MTTFTKDSLYLNVNFKAKDLDELCSIPYKSVWVYYPLEEKGHKFTGKSLYDNTYMVGLSPCNYMFRI